MSNPKNLETFSQDIPINASMKDGVFCLEVGPVKNPNPGAIIQAFGVCLRDFVETYTEIPKEDYKSVLERFLHGFNNIPSEELPVN